MDCEFTIKISQLIDGELSAAEAEQVNQHLTTCVICRQARADFLRLRQEVRAVEFAPDSFAQGRALRHILTDQTVTWWRRRVAVPIPVLALILIAIVAFGTWAIRRRELPGIRNQPARELPGHPAVTQASPPGLDLSRFDQGERAMVYVVRRGEDGSKENER